MRQKENEMEKSGWDELKDIEKREERNGSRIAGIMVCNV